MGMGQEVLVMLGGTFDWIDELDELEDDHLLKPLIETELDIGAEFPLTMFHYINEGGPSDRDNLGYFGFKLGVIREGDSEFNVTVNPENVIDMLNKIPSEIAEAFWNTVPQESISQDFSFHVVSYWG